MSNNYELTRRPVAKRLFSDVVVVPSVQPNEVLAFVSVEEPAERRADEHSVSSNALQSLVMNNRKLPALLRNHAPEFHIAGSAIEPLIATTSGMWGVLHSDIGKTIQHDGYPATIVNVHTDLRQIEIGGNRFWIPRRLSDRKRYSVERVNRGRSHLTLPAPVWHGDERPLGARGVRVRSNFPSQIMVKRLCADLGYPKDAASAFFMRAHAPWMSPSPDRRKNVCTSISETDRGSRQRAFVTLAQPAHPYNPASPSRRTHVGGGVTEEQVQIGLRKMRIEEAVKRALVEIVYRGRSTLQVADECGLAAENLYVYASRLRSHIRASAGADLHVQEKAA
jgi:hypothetical protein